MTDLLSEIRRAVRLLAKSPGFTTAAIAVLALGIGLNTAIFNLTYTLAFSPRPFPAPDRIVQLYTHDRKEPQNYRSFSYPIYREIAGRSDLFENVFAHTLSIVGVGENGDTRRSYTSLVSANYFDTLGVKLDQGRAFTIEEERPGSGSMVAIASHQYWKKTGFDPGLVGSTIRVNERIFTIVGITPEGFSGTMMVVGPEFYFPLGMFDLLSDDFAAQERRSLERADTYNLFLVARLADGVSQESAGAALHALGLALEHDFPVEFKDKTVAVGPLPRLGTSSSPSNESAVALSGLILLGMSGAVLLVVCMNLAGLLLARGHARRKEFAIRLALGGGRGRLVRQLLLEGMLLAVGGGGIGLSLAAFSTDFMSAAFNTRLPVTLFPVNGASPAILAATAGFCMLATLFFALGPALKLSRVDVLTDLKCQAGEGVAPSRRRWLPRHPLVVAQIAVSLALIVAASLFLRMAVRLTNLENSYRADHTVLIEVDAALGGFEETQARDLYRTVQERLATLPGVSAASVGSIVPYGLSTIGRSVRRAGVNPGPEDRPASAAEGQAFDARWNSIGADYFGTLGLPLMQGRAFTRTETDMPGASEVVIIDESLARKLWPEGDALGQRLQWVRADRKPGDEIRTLEIVGIVRATRHDIGQKEPEPAIFVPFAQGYRSNVFFHVRLEQDNAAAAQALIDPIRRAVREAAPGLPVFKVQTFRQHVESNLEIWMTRFSSALFMFFGGLSMLIAVVGIYGVKSYAVSCRTREIGIRMALGARPSSVESMILREGAVIAFSGICLGLLIAAGIGRVMAATFTDMEAFNPFVFALAACMFGTATMAACWLPARRAATVDPMVALRAE